MSLKYAGLDDYSAILPSDDELLERSGAIHVVVVVPMSTQGPLLDLYVNQAVDELLKARDERRDVYSFAECPPVKIDELKQNLGLVTKLIDIEEDHNSSVPGFVWNNKDEDGSDDHKMYMAYMKSHLKDVFCSDGTPTYFLEDSERDKDLLSINDARMEFAVKGTTDLVIVDKLALQYNDFTVGLCLIVEVKKDLSVNFEGHHRQTFCF